MTVWAVVPVKRFDRAKSRLASVLGTVERARLAREFFEHVTGVLEASGAVDRVAVVTDSDEVSALAVKRGALGLADPERAVTLADRVDFALAEVERRGATIAAVVMSDLPTLTAEDVRALVAEVAEGRVVVVPDARGRHTNALALETAARFPTAFGDPESFARHSERAVRAGLTLRTLRRSGFAFDVDTPDDYAELARLKR